MLDHDTDGYHKIARAFVDRQPVGNLTPGAHRRQHHAVTADGHRRVGGPLVPSPRSWVETAYPGVTYFKEAGSGGHFAAWEEPELFTAEVRAAFRSLR